jgi:hypothetical protein
MSRSFYITDLAQYDAETGPEMHNLWCEYKTPFLNLICVCVWEREREIKAFKNLAHLLYIILK